MKKYDDPLSGYGPGACIAKFAGAFVFGLFVDAAIIGGLFYFSRYSSWSLFPPWTVGVLVVVPIVWGTLGIFFFDRMLDLARGIFEDFLDPD